MEKLSNDQLNRLFEKGGVFVLMEAREGMEIGIDTKSWRIGSKFKGIKMIPQGFHFVYYSSISKAGDAGSRSGYVFFSEYEEIIAKKWNTEQEVIEQGDAKEIPNKYALDQYLGPYPLENYNIWIKLTNCITKEHLTRVVPGSFVGSMMSSNLEKSLEFSSEYLVKQGTEIGENQIRRTKASTEEILKFTLIDLKKSFPLNCSVEDKTKYSMDKSYLLRSVLRNSFNDDYKLLIGEFQLAFLIFVNTFNIEGFEQWKRFFVLISMSEEYISENIELYSTFMDTVYFQLKYTVESDGSGFIDDLILQGDNFMKLSSQFLFESLDALSLEDNKLKKSRDNLFSLFQDRFEWDFSYEE